jgi:antitoxin component of MazEF toxin-antitoxin module
MMCSLSSSNDNEKIFLPPDLLKLANIPITAPVEASFSDGVILLSKVKKRKIHIPLRERLKKSGWDGKRSETETINWGKPLGQEEW